MLSARVCGFYVPPMPIHRQRRPNWYPWVAGLALIWMLFGIMAFAIDLMIDEAALNAMTMAQRTLYESRPIWLLGVYGIATGAGLVGAIGLIMRRTWALIPLVVSLVAVVLQFAYTTFALDAIALLGPVHALGFSLVIVTIGALVLWLGVHARAKGWLR